jgi:hypothetical protein
MAWLASLIALIERLVSEWSRHKIRDEGRRQAQEVLDANVAKAEAAMDADDPARLDRLRDRFDRARR